MDTTWILIADAHRARCFERRPADQSLSELADFVHSTTRISSEPKGSDISGAAGKGHGRTGHAGTQFEPHTEAHAKERALFAGELAAYLNEGVATQRCNAIVLIATSPMLGELRPSLNSAAAKVLRRSVAADLTHYTGPELKERVTEYLLSER